MKHWLVSAPSEGGQGAYEMMREKLETKLGIGSVYPFRIPAFRVGTLDSLVSAVDFSRSCPVHFESCSLILSMESQITAMPPNSDVCILLSTSYVSFARADGTQRHSHETRSCN
mmetsp:Transcript_44548/g.172731  ORF Transcript_44548/g.172731 Transcript_44548/m.172731 type:complete len:114 (+) Transcript_44548:141-482(+)